MNILWYYNNDHSIIYVIRCDQNKNMEESNKYRFSSGTFCNIQWSEQECAYMKIKRLACKIKLIWSFQTKFDMVIICFNVIFTKWPIKPEQVYFLKNLMEDHSTVERSMHAEELTWSRRVYILLWSLPFYVNIYWPGSVWPILTASARLLTQKPVECSRSVRLVWRLFGSVST